MVHSYTANIVPLVSGYCLESKQKKNSKPFILIRNCTFQDQSFKKCEYEMIQYGFFFFFYRLPPLFYMIFIIYTINMQSISLLRVIIK